MKRWRKDVSDMKNIKEKFFIVKEVFIKYNKALQSGLQTYGTLASLKCSRMFSAVYGSVNTVYSKVTSKALWGR